MKTLHVSPKGHFSLAIDSIASDKSISHRCAIFSLLCKEPSYVKNYLQAEDTLCTLSIAQMLGAHVEHLSDGTLVITPPETISEPPTILDCGNSGTAIRLLMGFLSSCQGFFVLTGDKLVRFSLVPKRFYFHTEML